MKNTKLGVLSVAAMFYFGSDLHAQQTRRDSTTREKKIDEVVMIGYGSQRKENVTGSIGVISAKDIADRPNPNPVSSVQGKVSGVQIINSGAPGGSPRVDIRGVSSISGRAVFIVDGVITEDISNLNPQDIESMSVLKDPSSLAIFGAQASNGAVIIKTKAGRGKAVFNFNSYLGVKNITNMPKMANSDQYIELYNEKLRSEGVTDPTKMLYKTSNTADTNWLKDVLRSSLITSSDISASGSAKNLSYFLSAGYLRDEGNLAAGRGINSGDEFKKFNARANLTYKFSDAITIGNNFSISDINIDKARNPLLTAYSAPPVYYPINPATGNYDYITLVSLANPRAMLDLYRGKNKQVRYMDNVWGELKFLRDFTLRISYALDYANSLNYDYAPTQTYVPAASQQPPRLQRWDLRDRNYVWDNTLTWKHNYDRHHIELLGGFSRSEMHHYGTTQFSSGVAYDGTEKSLDVSKGTGLVYVDNLYRPDLDLVPDKTRIESVFGRLNYDFGGKYLINASVRRDGATGFSSEDRYHTFPAVSAGWVISKEGFMENQKIFSLLKLRGSWGQLGNPKVPRGYTLNTTQFPSGAYYGGVGYPAQTITEIVDPTISWETTEGRDVGLEMAFLQNKLKVEATYFSKDSKDVVYQINQPVLSGASNYANYITNAYSFNNKGFEGSISYNGRISEKSRFSLYGNITTLKNEITSVYGNSYNEPGAHLFGNTIIRLQTGQPVGSFYGFQVSGVFQDAAEVAAAPAQNGKTVGGFRFADQNGDGVIDDRDKTFLGSPIPKFTYGFGFTLNVAEFDLSVDFQGVYGNKIYNYNREQRYGNENWDLDTYNNRWHGAGTSNSYSMVTNNQAIILPSSFYVEDGSYFRIRNIQLGYNFSKNVASSMSVQRFRIYASAQNPLTIFKYHGFSPEILNTDRVQMGIDNNIYPMSAIYTFGVNVTF